ncbi:MAG: flagellar hook capping FlgD N-terminal domain-containing protein [Rhodothermales bacterium]
MTGLGIPSAFAEQAGASTDTKATAPGGALGRDEFLQLLVTQLANQDPMNPMDGQEFAAQLAQFTSVEQLVNISDVLAQNGEMNGMLAQSINSGVAAGLIGKSIEAGGNTVAWNGSDPAEMKFELASSAQNVKITIKDSAGITVRELEIGGRAAGKQTFEWDGATNQGHAATTGSYTFDVAAVDPSGSAVDVRTFTQGTVDRITFGQDGISIWIGGYSVPMSEVSSVQD